MKVKCPKCSQFARQYGERTECPHCGYCNEDDLPSSRINHRAHHKNRPLTRPYRKVNGSKEES